MTVESFDVVEEPVDDGVTVSVGRHDREGLSRRSKGDACCVKRRRGATGDELASIVVGSVVRFDGGVGVRVEGGDAVLWGKYDESGIGVEIVWRLW